jgi:hypothetical protein
MSSIVLRATAALVTLGRGTGAGADSSTAWKPSHDRQQPHTDGSLPGRH